MQDIVTIYQHNAIAIVHNSFERALPNHGWRIARVRGDPCRLWVTPHGLYRIIDAYFIKSYP
jgi:hypothetical protein